MPGRRRTSGRRPRPAAAEACSGGCGEGDASDPLRAGDEDLLRAVATFAASFGAGVAAYIAIADSGGGSPVCLGGGSGCETVADSSYSHVLGINIAVLGVLAYLLLLGAALARGDAARMGGFLIALAGFGYSVFLT